MPRSTLDTDLRTMADQAGSVVVQLRLVAAARRALPLVGHDADALADALHRCRENARDADADAENANLSRRHARQQLTKLVPALAEQARWYAAALDAAARRAEGDDVLTLRRIRRLVPARKERFYQLYGPLREIEAGVLAAGPLVAAHPDLAACAAAAAPLLAKATAAIHTEDAADVTFERALHARGRARLALFDQLRAVREAWHAASFAADIPALDLRESRAAHRKRAPSTSTAADNLGALPHAVSADDSDPSAPADGPAPTPASPDGEAPAGGPAATILSPCLPPDADATATVVIQVTAAAG
jgi:hypothetical protein